MPSQALRISDAGIDDAFMMRFSLISLAIALS
jgi:hypothetical protein